MITTRRPEKIRYTADVVALREGMHGPLVLLIQRGSPPHEGRWALPGGHVDRGETARAAAVRELFEETGVRVAESDLRQVGVFDAPGRDPRGRYVTVAYEVTVTPGTTARAGDDAAAVRWRQLDDLPKLAVDHGQIIEAAVASGAATGLPGEEL